MSYVVLARRYRPQTFEDLVGQEPIVTTLKNAIHHNRVAHAYLLAGPRGVGKTSTARILSKALNCQHGPTITPCNTCDICRCISEGNDIDVLEIDGASNRGIDEIRNIRQNAWYAPSRSRYKIYIIDEVHMLTREAFNALLKTLEEPPPHVKFIFATTAANRLPETVQSRCQRFDLKNISTKDIEKRLSDICKLEGIQVEPPVLQLIARHAKGGLRDSQSILDQLFSFCKDKVSLEDVNFVLGCIDEDRMLGIFDSISGKDTSSALKIVNDILNDGKTPNEFIDQALSCTRDLLVFSSCGAEANWIETDTYFMQKHGKSFSPETLLYMIQILSDARMRTTDFLVQRILLEAAVIKLCRMESLSTLHEIAEKITLLEKNIAHVTHISGNSIEGSVSSQKAVIQQKEKVSESPEEYLAKDEEKRQETLLRENDAWEKILIKINNKKKAVWALLKESRLVGIKNGEITVEFPGAYSFHMEKLNRTEEKKFIEQCAQEVLQTDARLIFTLSKNGNLTGNKVNPISNYDSLDHQENNTIPSEPAVKKTLELFGGQIIRAK